MNNLAYITLTTFLISLIAFSGVLVLFLKEKLLNKILLFLVALAAGGLIGGAFFHLIPKTLSEGGDPMILCFFLILGFCIFFVLEIIFLWHHHHSVNHEKCKPISYLVLISDSIHNFIDGLIIAASFSISTSTGIITAIAVALHEIPQEIGDFGVLLYSGFKKVKALVFNFLTAITVVLGGIAGYLMVEKIGEAIIYLLPFAAGNFIYIAASDLIPEIKHEKNIKISIAYFVVFLLGISFMLLIKFI